MTTDFGERVIAAGSAPAHPLKVDGKGFDIPSGPPGSEGNPLPPQVPTATSRNPLVEEPQFDSQSTGGSLFGGETPDLLFQPQPKSGIAPSLAANRAYAESLVLGESDSYPALREAQLTENVESESIARISALMDEQRVVNTGVLDPANNLTSDQRIEAITNEIQRLDLRRVDPKDLALFAFFMSGGGELPKAEFEKRYRSVDITQLDQLRDQLVVDARARSRRDVDDIVASRSFGSYGEMVREVAVQDFTPIFNILSRIGFNREVAEAVGAQPASGWSGFFVGEIRQNIREELVSATPDEYRQKMAALGQMIEELEGNEAIAPLLTKYNVLESMEAIFTEDVYKGLNADNTFDRVFGNLETVLEGVFSVMTVFKGGKTMRAAFRDTDKMRARQVARRTDQHAAASGFDEALQLDQLALDFGLDADEAVPTMLARPATFADDVDNVPDGTKDVIARSERLRSETLEQSDANTGQGLTKQDKTSAVNQTIADLDLNDGLHVQGRMNTLQMLENDNGFRMRVVVGETAEGGFKNVEDAMREVLDIDPLLENVNLMRVSREGILEPVFDSTEAFQNAAFKGEFDQSSAGQILGTGDEVDETFYLAFDRERFWHTTDKEVLSPESFLSSGVLPRAVLAPNAKFGDEIYGTFVRAYMGEQSILKNLELMFAPFYKLGPDDKRFVSSAFEWMEDYGKQNGRAPTLTETLGHYDGVTEAQASGLVAMRTGMDTMHELFNRKLYRDWQALGFRTARPSNSTLPTFHGNALDRTSVQAGWFMDPETGTLVRATTQDIDNLYNEGGRIMKLDMRMDVPNEARSKADLVMLRPTRYEVGELSTRPLVYHPGYSIRFYDDPYYIVKKTSGVSLNGSLRSGDGSVVSEAIRTAGSANEAESFIRRAVRADGRRSVEGVDYEVIRASDISNTESTLFQKEAIHREGRLFWDERNAERLPDVNGSRATLEDPVKSLERGVALAARQLTHEDPLKQVKNAWKNEFGDLIPPEMLERLDVGEISKQLRITRQATVGVADQARVQKAKELIDYLRLIEGTESAMVPFMREQAINLAAWVGRTTNGAVNTGRAEKYFQTMDPFRTMRSVAFNAFMVFRPLRQALLQSAQIGYLAALNPKYVASIQFYKDAFQLRRGVTALRKSGYDDGISVASAAKSMGMTTREYRTLIKEFDRSGIIDLVDVHSFAGGSRQSQKLAIPKGESRLGTVGYRAKQAPVELRNFMQRIGFNLGEGNNLVFTYNLALKRTMERNKYTSVLDMSRSDWDGLRVEASNLALGMLRPNNFGYQTGALGVATQFLSFSHKAALGLLGANPAIKGQDALKILGMTYLLYGANMYGARDFASDQLKSMGLEDLPIPGGDGETLVDLISGGIIETTFNALGDLTSDDFKDMDLAFLAPGVDLSRFWEMQLQGLMDQPTQAVFGAFGNIFSKTQKSFAFMEWVHAGEPDRDPGDKFLDTAHALAMGIFPAYNDVTMSYMGYQTNLWYSASGEALPLRPTMNTLIARAAFGARSREELGYYRLQNKIWESEETINDIVRANRENMTKVIGLWGRGELTDVQVERHMKMMTNMIEDFPEGVRLKILKDSVLKELTPGLPTVEKQLMETLNNRAFDPREVALIVDRFTDIPREKREQVKELALEAWQSRINVEAEGIEQLQDELGTEE